MFSLLAFIFQIIFMTIMGFFAFFASNPLLVIGLSMLMVLLYKKGTDKVVSSALVLPLIIVLSIFYFLRDVM